MAANKMLIRWRGEVVVQLMKECDLTMSVELVPSKKNVANVLTRVPAKWIKCQGLEDVVAAMDLEDMKAIHEAVSHPVVDKTRYFVRKKDPNMTWRMVHMVVR